MDTNMVHITGSHALALMRAARAKKIVSAIPADTSHVVSPPHKLATLDDLHIDDLLTWLGVTPTNQLRVLTPNAKARSWIPNTFPSILSGELPPNSALELVQVPGQYGDDAPQPLRWDPRTRVFIDAPALALVHASQTLEKFMTHGKMNELEVLLRLISLSCELCGSYARDPLNPMTERCYFDPAGECNRFASPQQLRTALEHMEARNGLAHARKAARHTLDFSGSPMETYVDTGLFLPPRLGGMSLLMPHLNQQLTIDDTQRELLRHQSLRPDMHWPEQLTLAEYFGDKEHADKSARLEDKNRIQDYGIANYKTFILMYDDVKDIDSLTNTATMLARALVEGGAKSELYRLKRNSKIEGFKDRQRLLAKVMLPSAAAS